MNSIIQLQPVGSPDGELLEWLADELSGQFRVECLLLPTMDASFAWHPDRKQCHSTEVLEALRAQRDRRAWRVLAVTQLDLFIPILTFVFGEAYLGGQYAVVSYHRLQQEYYGLPADRDLLARRLLIESVHEIGHTLHLKHCPDHSCVMSSSHSVEWIDIKDNRFCSNCAENARVMV